MFITFIKMHAWGMNGDINCPLRIKWGQDFIFFSMLEKKKFYPLGQILYIQQVLHKD